MEIVFPDKQYVSDPHTARLPLYSPTPQQPQLGDGVSGMNTQTIMPDIELNPAEEALIDVEEDPLQLDDTDMENVEDNRQIEVGNAENGNNTPKQGGKVDDKESSEFK